MLDSLADYDGDEGSTTVASCDIYDFADGHLAAITSSAVEIEPGSTST